MKEEIIHDAKNLRFEIVVDGYTAHVEYLIVDNTFDIIHTIVPRAIGGRGIAGELVEVAYKYAYDAGYNLKSTCSYAAAWLRKHQ